MRCANGTSSSAMERQRRVDDAIRCWRLSGLTDRLNQVADELTNQYVVQARPS